MTEWVPDDHAFALCLTHDVDRPYRTYQALYYAIKERRLAHLHSLLPGRNPYWTFDDLLAIERDLGVTSAFYFLDEQDILRDRPATEWLSPKAWRLYAGRYDILDREIMALICDLAARGWEVGLHGSYESYTDRALLRREKATLEAVLGEPVLGGRQHYLRVERPETWEHQRAVGLRYDATPGSPDEYGFQEGDRPFRPFDDDFVVFPLTLMDGALPDLAEDFDRAWADCEALLAAARDRRAVMTVLWHPRYFCELDHPGHRELYRRLVERALELDAWVGPPGDLYRIVMDDGGARVTPRPEEG